MSAETDYSSPIDAVVDNDVLIKREDLQPVVSFKLRGAYNKIVGLDDAQRQRGVITASAGNHAQGVALAAAAARVEVRETAALQR